MRYERRSTSVVAPPIVKFCWMRCECPEKSGSVNGGLGVLPDAKMNACVCAGLGVAYGPPPPQICAAASVPGPVAADARMLASIKTKPSMKAPFIRAVATLGRKPRARRLSDERRAATVRRPGAPCGARGEGVTPDCCQAFCRRPTRVQPLMS
jgi:hypothetical protein